MKKIALLFLLIFVCSACDNDGVKGEAKDTEITIEKLNIQEIDNGQLFKEITVEKNKVIQEKLGILNDNFKTVPKPNACQSVGSFNAGNYSIENIVKYKKSLRPIYSFKIYNHENNICEFIQEVKDARVVSTAFFNNKLYLEIDNLATSKKNNFVVYEYERLNILKADIGHINNFAVSDNNLYISVGKNIYVLNKDDKLEKMVNPYKDRNFFTIFNDNGNIFVIYKMKKNFELIGEEYKLKDNLGENDKPSNINNYDVIKTTKINANDNHFIAYLKPIVTQVSDDYVIIDNKLICRTNLDVCYRVAIAGEEIMSLIDNKILLSSDNVYLADFDKKIKTEIAKDGVEGFVIINGNIYFKMNKNNSETYLKYELVK